MLFSIIVPIYKVEDYLESCIWSVLNQDFQDFELILVNDGSPDKCPEICDKYSTMDNRIVVVHKNNGGLSDARNSGLEISQGNYIIFLDSDDLMFEGALSHIYSQLNDTKDLELLIGNYTYYIDNKPAGKIAYPDVLLQYPTNNIYRTCTKFIQEINYLPWKAYQCVYEKKYLTKYNYTYDKNIIGAEDCEFFMRIISTVKKYKITNHSFVYYRKNRPDSIMATQSFNTILGQLMVLSKYYNNFNDNKTESEIIRRYFANRYTNIIILIATLKVREEIDWCNEVIHKNMKILKGTKGGKYIAAKLCWKILGVYKGSKILYRIRNSSKFLVFSNKNKNATFIV